MEKILMIRFGSLGDVILTTPVTKALKEKYPDSELHVLVKKEFAQVFKDSPYVDKIISFDSKDGKLFELLDELNNNSYSIVIDLHRNLRSILLYKLLKAKRKLHYKKGALKRRLLVSFKVRFKDMPHTVEKYLAPLKSPDIDPTGNLPFITLSQEDEDFARDFFAKISIDNNAKVFAIAPGAKNRAKMYPKKKFTNLINMLAKRLGAHVILVGSDADKKVIDEITESVEDKDKVTSLTDSSLKESAAVLKCCEKLITNDSGPMHIAVAVGTPVVALFGPTDKRFGFYPLGADDVVLTKEYNCSPCSLHGKKECEKYGYKCLNDITEDDIFKEIA